MANKSPSGTSYIRMLTGLVLTVGILYLAKSFVVPLALAVLITFVLSPIVVHLQRHHVPRIAAVLLTAVVALGAFGLILAELGSQVNALVHQLPEHKEKIKKKIDDLRGSKDGALAKFLEMVREITEDPEKTAERVNAERTNADVTDKPVVVVKTDEPSNLQKLAYVVLPVFEPLATAGLVIILVLFMLNSREDLRNRFISLLGHGHLTGTTRVIVDAAQRVSSYLLTQLLVNVTFGVIFAIGLLIIGVPYAFLWGCITGILRFIPYVGTWLSVAFPLVLSFALAPDWTQPITVLVFFAVMDLVVANAIEPLLFGHRTGVTPIALLVAAAFWTWVWGPIGLVLSTPMTVCLVVLGQHVPQFRFFALLLGDEPPLETHISYYQRLLSRDVEESRQIALNYAKTKGQELACEDVLMPALVLAGIDRQSQVLDSEDEDFICQDINEIISVFEKQNTEAAAGSDQLLPDKGSAAASGLQVNILGCPAHQKTEELPLRMLSLLLKPHGVRVDIMSTRNLPTEVAENIAVQKPALVFIAVLPPGGLVQAAYLSRRLRKRFKDLTIVIGCWGGASTTTRC